jgi:hypothetical protein
VTADAYVFCGNGEHENPDLRVLSLIAERRFTENGGAPFKFWFNCHSTVSERDAGSRHMLEIEHLMARLEAESGGRLTAEFLTGSSFEVPV